MGFRSGRAWGITPQRLPATHRALQQLEANPVAACFPSLPPGSLPAFLWRARLAARSLGASDSDVNYYYYCHKYGIACLFALNTEHSASGAPDLCWTRFVFVRCVRVGCCHSACVCAFLSLFVGLQGRRVAGWMVAGRWSLGRSLGFRSAHCRPPPIICAQAAAQYILLLSAFPIVSRTFFLLSSFFLSVTHPGAIPICIDNWRSSRLRSMRPERVDLELAPMAATPQRICNRDGTGRSARASWPPGGQP